MSQMPNKERGPAGLPSFDHVDGQPEAAEKFDFGILANVIPRQWKTAPFADPLLALEILDGPYKGVVFGFSSFTVMPQKLEDGLVPAKFETSIYSAPKDFQQDEGFDFYCRELLLAWLHYIAMNDLSGLIRSEPHKGIQ